MEKEAMTRYSVYALREPNGGDIRYIGRSIKPRSRLSFHKVRGPASQWISALRQRGAEPELLILAWGDKGIATWIEDSLIIYYAQFGKLLNRDIPTEEPVDPPEENSPVLTVVDVARLGGKARSAMLSKAERVALAKNAVNERWRRWREKTDAEREKIRRKRAITRKKRKK